MLGRDNYRRATCLNCFHRVVADDRDAKYVDDPIAPGPCEHKNKQALPIVTAVQENEKQPFRAVCEDCGVVLIHDDGPGGWREYMFYGYRIEEEP